MQLASPVAHTVTTRTGSPIVLGEARVTQGPDFQLPGQWKNLVQDGIIASGFASVDAAVRSMLGKRFDQNNHGYVGFVQHGDTVDAVRLLVDGVTGEPGSSDNIVSIRQLRMVENSPLKAVWMLSNYPFQFDVDPVGTPSNEAASPARSA